MNQITSPLQDSKAPARVNFARGAWVRCSLLLALAFVLGACAPHQVSLSPSRAPSRPERFKAFFSDRFGTIQTVELRGDTVISTVQGAAFRNAIYGPIQKEHRVRPTEPEWQAFRAALNRADIWEWLGTYRNAEFTGGPAWSFEVVYPRRRVITTGYTSYPSDGTPSVPADKESRRYQIVESAVERLIGRRLFN